MQIGGRAAAEMHLAERQRSIARAAAIQRAPFAQHGGDDTAATSAWLRVTPHVAAAERAQRLAERDVHVQRGALRRPAVRERSIRDARATRLRSESTPSTAPSGSSCSAGPGQPYLRSSRRRDARHPNISRCSCTKRRTFVFRRLLQDAVAEAADPAARAVAGSASTLTEHRANARFHLALRAAASSPGRCCPGSQ